jgi:hypothetical protein
MFTASSTPIKVTKKNSHKCDKDSNIFKHSKFIAFWRPFGDLLHPPTSSNIPKIFPSCGQPSRSRNSKAAALSWRPYELGMGQMWSHVRPRNPHRFWWFLDSF